MTKAEIILNTRTSGRHEYLVTGTWTIHALSSQWSELRAKTNKINPSEKHSYAWNLLGIEEVDSAGIHWLWDLWGQKLPHNIQCSPELQERFAWLEKNQPIRPDTTSTWSLLTRLISLLGSRVLRSKDWLFGMLAMIGQLVLDIAHIIRHPKTFPMKEVTAQIYHVGAQALVITAMVGFLIGIVLSYLAAYQLQIYGADGLVVNLLSMATLRELGPLLAAILVAGRSGSAMTAQIGVMRLNQELDAMSVIGIARGRRLILPRILGLTIALPLLVLWTNLVALLGGAIGAWIQMDLSPLFFLEQLPYVTKLAHYWIGISKGAVYGFLIALIACRYGLMIQPNTESLGACTTASVVSSITGIILANALFAIIFKGV